MRRSQTHRATGILLAWALGASCMPRTACAEDRPALEADLLQIDHQRTGRHKDMKRLERKCLALLDEHSSDEARGTVYAAIALMYVRDGGRPAEKVIEYCRKAVRYDLPPLTLISLYSSWGGALEIRYRYGRVTTVPFSVTRKEIVVPYLNGLRVVTDYQTAREIQDWPVIPQLHYWGSPTDPAYREAVQRRKKLLEDRERILFHNDLIDARHRTEGRVISLYCDGPHRHEELGRLAGEVLGAGHAHQLVAEVRKRTENRQ